MPRQRAFTLLELLVVISIIGLIAGVIAPRFINIGDKLAVKNEFSEVRQQLNGLPLRAMRSGNALRIDAQGAPVSLPGDWHITAATAIIYQANGSCLGGTIEVWQGHGSHKSVHLQPPFCQWAP